MCQMTHLTNDTFSISILLYTKQMTLISIETETLVDLDTILVQVVGKGSYTEPEWETKK